MKITKPIKTIQWAVELTGLGGNGHPNGLRVIIELPTRAAQRRMFKAMQSRGLCQMLRDLKYSGTVTR